MGVDSSDEAVMVLTLHLRSSRVNWFHKWSRLSWLNLVLKRSS